MTANPVTAQDALDLDDLKAKVTSVMFTHEMHDGSDYDSGIVVGIQATINYLASRNLLAQPRIDLDALKRPLRGADIGRYDMDYSFDQGWNQCIDEIRARTGEAQPRNDAEAVPKTTDYYEPETLTAEQRQIYEKYIGSALVHAKTWARSDAEYIAAKIGAHRALVGLLKNGLTITALQSAQKERGE